METHKMASFVMLDDGRVLGVWNTPDGRQDLMLLSWHDLIAPSAEIGHWH